MPEQFRHAEHVTDTLIILWLQSRVNLQLATLKVVKVCVSEGLYWKCGLHDKTNAVEQITTTNTSPKRIKINNTFILLMGFCDTFTIVLILIIYTISEYENRPKVCD